MKRLFILVVMGLLSWATIANAQSDSVVVNVQEETLVEDYMMNEKKGRFQCGVTLRYGGTCLSSTEKAIVFAGGYRFNRRNYLGLNIGVARAEYGVNWDRGYQSGKYIGCPISWIISIISR